MKSIVFFALFIAVALSAPLNAYVEDKKVMFDFDVYQDAPVGFVMKGEIDPRNDQTNKIQTFIRLANQYIPVLESIASQGNELTWQQNWHIGFMGFNIDVSLYFQLLVGWRVTPGGYTTDRFDVTYTPFVWGVTHGRVNGTSFPAIGNSDVGLRYISAQAPISFRLYRAGRICFQGSYHIEPVHMRQHLFAALNQCQDEIFDDLINGQTVFDFRCNYTNPVNITIWDFNFTNPIQGDFIGETCISF